MGRSPTKVSIESHRGQPWTAAPAGGGLAEYTRGIGGAIAVRPFPKRRTIHLQRRDRAHGGTADAAKIVGGESLYARLRIAKLPRCSAADGPPSQSTSHPQPCTASSLAFSTVVHNLCTNRAAGCVGAAGSRSPGWPGDWYARAWE